MENWERHQQRAAEEVKYMSEHEDFFKCGDCKWEQRCPVVDPDSRTCVMFYPKRKARLPIENMLFDKIAGTGSGEPITLSLKEKEIMLVVLNKDINEILKKTKSR